MNNKAMGAVALVAIVLGLFLIGTVIFQYPKLKAFVNENIIGVRPEAKIEGTTGGYVDIIIKLSSDHDEAVKQLVDQTLYCWREFERSGYTDQLCAKIVPDMALSKSITQSEYLALLSNSGDLAKDIAGTAWWGMALNNYFWEIGVISPGDPPFWICADDDGGNQVGFTYQTEGGDCH